MNRQVQINTATAARVAEYFESTGLVSAAVNVRQTLCSTAPYDRGAREKLADLLFNLDESAHPLGTVERSRFLLAAISQSYPTPTLTHAYFENLEQLFKSRAKRARPGEVILGVGAGRCGSTTLAAVFGSVSDDCATHETPPFIYWEPLEEQVRFHFDRLRVLANYFSLVFDAAHWWLNVLGEFFAEFPAGKAVGLIRGDDLCVESFLHVKGRDSQSINHWAIPGNPAWVPNLWDPVYPSFDVPANLLDNPKAAKASMIQRYVTEYNATLRTLAETFPERLHLLRTEDLNLPQSVASLSTLAGRPVTMPAAALNASGTVSDSGREDFLF